MKIILTANIYNIFEYNGAKRRLTSVVEGEALNNIVRRSR